MTDAEKIEAFNDVLDKLLDWDRRPSKAAGARFDKAVVLVLTELLGRKPTPEEKDAACK